MQSWIGTVAIETSRKFLEKIRDDRLLALRRESLLAIVREINKRTKGEGVVLFPAGYFKTRKRVRNSLIPNNVKDCIGEISDWLSRLERNIIICLGIDGGVKGSLKIEDPPKDQIAVAVGKNGIISVGRKFYPRGKERNRIQVGEATTSERIFPLGRKQYYLAVCYDIFGIKHKHLKNPGVDVILNLIHEFTRRGEGSGMSYFTRLGLGCASSEWSCPVYASAFLINRTISEEWPMGVQYGGTNALRAKYDDIRIEEEESFREDVEEEKVLVKIY